MRNKRYSNGFSHALMHSKEEALRLRSAKIGTEHLLLGLLQDSNSTASRLMKEMVGNLDDLRREVETCLPTTDEATPNTTEYTVNQPAQVVLRGALGEATEAGDAVIGTSHLLLALLKYDHVIGTLLEGRGLSYNAVRERLRSLQEEQTDEFDFEEEADEGEPGEAKEAPATRTKKGDKEGTATPFLDKFGTDFTSLAANGKLDPVVGRTREIERVAQILSRRKKNNPILIGEPGVGKTAIVEGLAQRIASKDVPVSLFGKRLVSLNMAMIVAGTKYRGEFEKRIQTMLSELETHPEIILFIDEIHTIIGAGSASGSLDAANMLKPALSRGKLQCIGSTTVSEYRKSIEKDGALERRFQKIMVEPTTSEQTLEILRQIKAGYEQHHNVCYSDEALQACVSLTDRYISSRQQPDKAIDAMDEAGSRMHIRKIAVPTALRDLEQTISDTAARKMLAVKSQDFEAAARLRNEEIELTAKLEQQKHDWEASLLRDRLTVSRKEVEETVSTMSGVPVQRMITDENLRLKDLKAGLLANVIAQDKAIEKVVRAITRNRIGLRDPNKPIGTFLFLGPTGVGKTYLAKQLAEHMFGSADALIRIDMSEYMESFSVSRLVGAPPGYVGYEEGGQLTEAVRRHPYSIVLLDEIEKANRNVYNILLQLMDEGRLTDSNGVTVDFRNTILIITSNVGTRQVSEFGGGVGFIKGDEEQRARLSGEIIDKALRKQFAPEFLNRLDEIVMFDPLNREAIAKITALELKQLASRVKALGYELELSSSAQDFLISKGYDKNYGARQLRRTIQTFVEDGLSDFLLASPPSSPTIHVTHDEGADRLTFS